MCFAKIADVTAGTQLTPDDGFTCLKGGETVAVLADDKGELYVPCSDGRHYLDGQIEGDVYIGLSLATTTAAAA